MCAIFKCHIGAFFQSHEHKIGNRKLIISIQPECCTSQLHVFYASSRVQPNICEDCVTYWYIVKERRLGQRKCKAYSKRKSTLKKCKTFDIRELSSVSSRESSESDSVSSETDDEALCIFVDDVALFISRTVLKYFQNKKNCLLIKSFVIICLCIASSLS